jgi:methanogenic corrinoid protein MtbC1
LKAAAGRVAQPAAPDAVFQAVHADVLAGNDAGIKAHVQELLNQGLVSTMLRGVGFDVVDLGINLSVEDFVANVEKHRPDILGMSALLTTTMPEMKKVIDLLVTRGLRNTVKVIVGGAPVNEKFARDIGADGYGADAGSSVDLARKLLQKTT